MAIAPEALAAKHVKSPGAVLRNAVRPLQHPGLMPKAAQPQSGLLRKVKHATGEAGAGEIVYRRRIACDGLWDFAAKLIEKRNPSLGLLGPYVENQRR